MNDMRKRMKKKVKEPEFATDDTVVASTDLTGLIPTPPKDASQAESYADLHHIPIPDDIGKR